jgi:exo-1,4-beta-D-glucosaminidase
MGGMGARMRRAHVIPMLFLFFLFAFTNTGHCGPAAPSSARFPLEKGWAIRSSCDVHARGEEISRAGFDTSGWLKTSVPATALGAQVAAGRFENPYFGKNLLKIPGTDYPEGKIYANLPLTANSPYRCSWWYRTEFELPSDWRQMTWMHFNGINYRASIWVNGTLIANDQQVIGAYRSYEFEISKLLHPGKNAVAVETFVQTETDLGINFVDWNPAPADKSLGLWRDVYLERSGPIRLSNPAVLTKFADDQLSAADLTVVADLTNATGEAQQGVVRGRIGATAFEKTVELAPHETKTVRFTPDDFPVLHFVSPSVWWPYQYGKPALENLELSVDVAGKRSETRSLRFGIREVSGKINEKGALQIQINRRNILIRGGGWSPDMFYREPKGRMMQELEYVKQMHLNTVRLEGKLGSEDLFDAADEMGILVMAGWCCCDHWEHWSKWTPRDHEIATASLFSQISRLRAHPSVFVWLNGSDNPPPADVEQAYIAVLKERDWQNPYVSSASATPTTVTGPSGVKMSGPYDYVPPEYYYLDKNKRGGAYGFNTETSPGPAIPSAQCIRQTLPQGSWWPIDDEWNYHAGMGKFAQYNIFTDAMGRSLGPASNLENYARKSQLMAYDAERAMFEAYSANKYTSTGVIQWMLNNAWPSFIWHLYDYYLTPGGGYFGTRKANELLHVQYRYDERTVDVVNSTLDARKQLAVAASLYDLAGKRIYADKTTVDLGPDGVARTLTVPGQTATAFLKLELRDAAGKLLSDNFYVLPAKLADLEWEKSNYFYTPANSYGDLHDLAQLPKATVNSTARYGAGKGVVRLTNTGEGVAFFLHARAVKRGTDEEIAPVHWSDNFVSLLPGESRELTYELPAFSGGPVSVKLDGWNLAARTLAVSAAK